ncbi:hypothetical protein AMAG_02285 [Allomyces macrogynus ATCC 38327]|uniref:Mitochondrial resolvase Ydc2 catalytic domain-containing protein n=1 Tax=Allomyces macrogynus (strain ATCC 38327) TaxID=578462 RepID=A0A0L0S1P8_ALLM3|nr:hypothetical protein AMAG_02285 [Allomyces macrogynus ATCC 38327]|eukprot:KNE56482.1 hypothetical protein AMAG_02285 [Allomyces macrogynus ATCC 38327]
MTSIPTSLTRLTVPALKHLCKSAGVVGLPTRKAEIAAKLTAHLHATAQRGTVPRIISIDVGFRNLAWAYLHGSELRAWQRVTLVPAADDAADEAATERVYDPRVFAVSVHELVAKIDAESNSTGGTAGATTRPVAAGAAATDGPAQYVIERQRMVGVGKASFSVFMVNMVEGMLWSSLTQPARLAAGTTWPVLTSLPPGAVSKWFEHGGNKKKRTATNLTKALLASRFIEEVDSPSALTANADGARSLKIPSALVRQFHLEKKKDDLADALLQALAVADWTANSVHLARLHGIMAADAAAAPSTWQQAMAELG